MTRETDHAIDPIGDHTVALILNERDEGRHYDGAPGKTEPRQLVDQALPCARRQEDGAVSPRQDFLDGLELPLSEICFCEYRLQEDSQRPIDVWTITVRTDATVHSIAASVKEVHGNNG